VADGVGVMVVVGVAVSNNGLVGMGGSVRLGVISQGESVIVTVIVGVVVG